jgi:tRNA 2-thiouridine synthesizing protein C
VSKRFLFVMQSCPHVGTQLEENLDMILTAASMDQTVSLLFLDDGVFQLLEGQNPAVIGRKHVAPIFQALPLYDVDSFWIELESLQERSLEDRALTLPVQVVARSKVAALMASHDIVVMC